MIISGNRLNYIFFCAYNTLVLWCSKRLGAWRAERPLAAHELFLRSCMRIREATDENIFNAIHFFHVMMEAAGESQASPLTIIKK